MTQVRTDESTWTYSDNAVVALFNYCMDSDGYAFPYERLERNLDAWMKAMDVADEPVELAGGGTTRRYRVAGSYYLSDPPKDVAQRFLDCCDGRLWMKRDGSIGIAVGKFETPTVTISDEHILGWTGLTLGQDPVTAVAGIRAEYMSPDHDYREHEAEPWPDGDTVIALGEDRVAALDLLWVPTHSQARRLMKRAFKRATARWRGTIHTDLYGLKAIDERYIDVEIAELGISESFEVGRHDIDLSTMTCSIEILSLDATVDDFDAETEEMPEDSGLVFGVADYGASSGYQLSPVTTLGGKAGQVCVVLVAIASGSIGVASTPSGWTLIGKAGITSSMSIGAFAKLLDGSETAAVSFLGGAGGGYHWVLLDGMTQGFSATDLNVEIATGTPASAVKEGLVSPYAVFAFGAVNASVSGSDWLRLSEAAGDDAGTDITRRSTVSGTTTLVTKIAEYGTPEDPADLIAEMDDGGTNAFLSFIIQPG